MVYANLSKLGGSDRFITALGKATGNCAECNRAQQVTQVVFSLLQMKAEPKKVGKKNIDFNNAFSIECPMVEIKICKKHNKCGVSDCENNIGHLLSCGHFLCENHFKFFEEKIENVFVCRKCHKILCSMCECELENNVFGYDGNEQGRYGKCNKDGMKIYEGIKNEEFEYLYKKAQ
ncbi:MAG: hypothetical protein II393_01870 [Cytophagales bacterium]|nr:hypothetical protein [Cytophagales bacterium]